MAELAAAAAHRCRPELRPDAAGAALLAEAAVRAAQALIDANLVTTGEDERLERVRALAGGARASVERALTGAESSA